MLDDLPRWVHQVGPQQLASGTRARLASSVRAAAQGAGFVYRYWTVPNTMVLATNHFPQVATLLRAGSCAESAQVAIARYVVLMVYGGVCIDVDYKIRGTLQALFVTRKRGEVSFSRRRQVWPLGNVLSTDIMAAPPAHGIWRAALAEVLYRHTYQIVIPFEPYLAGEWMINHVLDIHNNITLHFIDGLTESDPPVAEHKHGPRPVWSHRAAMTVLITLVVVLL